MKNPVIIHAAGFISTNIGNAFYGSGIEYVLNSLFPQARVITTTNVPGNYWPEAFRLGNNILNYLETIEADYIVFAGPIFDNTFETLYGTLLRRLHKKGVKILFLSAGLNQYTDEEIKIAGELLSEIKPFALITRDTQTYEALNKYAEHSYNGVDFAFFIPDYFSPYKISLDNYVIFNFDSCPEPDFAKDKIGERYFDFNGNRWFIRVNELNRYKRQLFIYMPWLFGKRQNFKLDNRIIVRPNNRVNGISGNTLFRAKNSFASEIPNDYLNLFANTELTLSDRVHTCLATVSLGKPAMLFTRSKRAHLFERVGLEKIHEEPVYLDNSYITDEKIKLKNFLQSIIK